MNVMLLYGILDELCLAIKLAAQEVNNTEIYFFSHATYGQVCLNSIIDVLRGLIYLFVEQQPSIVSYVQKIEALDVETDLLWLLHSNPGKFVSG